MGIVPFAQDDNDEMIVYGRDSEDDDDDDDENAHYAHSVGSVLETRWVVVRCGGSLLDSPCANANLFDLEKNYWTVLPDMNYERICCHAVMVGSRLIVVGGDINQNQENNDLQFHIKTRGSVDLDQDNNDDSDSNPRQHKRDESEEAKQTTMEKDGGKRGSGVDAFHKNIDEETEEANKSQGSTVEEFDWQEKKWVLLPNMQEKRWNHSACAIGSDENLDEARKLMVAGGWNPITKQFLKSVEIFDTSNHQWKQLADTLYPHMNGTMIEWKYQRTVLLIGGQSGDALNNFRKVESYDFESREWTELAELQFNHGFNPAAWCDENDGLIYVTGNGTQDKSVIECYNYKENVWQTFYHGNNRLHSLKKPKRIHSSNATEFAMLGEVQHNNSSFNVRRMIGCWMNDSLISKLKKEQDQEPTELMDEI